MKNLRLNLLLAFLGITAAASFGQVPILQYTFNESGTTAASTGSNLTPLTLLDTSGSAADLHSAGGLGVSGSPADIAFDNTASTGMGTAGVGGVALLPPGTTGTLASFTFQCWVNVATQLDNLARLIDCNTISIQADAGAMVFHVNGVLTTSTAAYTGTGQWIFLAVTYDGTKTSDNVVFYEGTSTTPVTQVGAVATLNGGPVVQTDALGFGNDRNLTNARPVDGYMDDIRLYGSATNNSGVLNPVQLENLRLRDLKNLPDALEADKISISGSIIQETGTSGQTTVKAINIPNVLGTLGITNAPSDKTLHYAYDSTTQSFVIATKAEIATGSGNPVATVLTLGSGVNWDPTTHSVIQASSASGLNSNLSGAALVNGVVHKTETDNITFTLFGTLSSHQTIVKGSVVDTEAEK